MVQVNLKGIKYNDNIKKLYDAFNINKRLIEWALRHLDGGNFNTTTINIPPIDPEKPAPVDSYGLNETYLDFYPNLFFNSGLENFDSVTMKPAYFDTDGVVTANSRFESNNSLMLTPGQYAIQVEDDLSRGLADPAWYPWCPDTRYAFNVKGSGSVTVQVLQGGSPVSLWVWTKDATGKDIKQIATSFIFNAASDWPTSRMTFAATPNVSGGKIALSIVNGTGTVYIDGFICRPDWTGRYPGLYKPGPFSGAATVSEEWDEYGVGDYNPAGIEFVFEQAYIYMPDWIKASWFCDAGGTGTEALSPIDFRITLVKETFTVNGVPTLCYSKALVMPFSDALPSSIVGGKISLRALCRGAVAKPEV